MKLELTRRNILGTLGATAGAVATSCGQSNPSLLAATPIPGRVNLICHGQMLFLWEGGDYIKILLPEPPSNAGGKELHKIYLGGPKGKNNVLPPLQPGGPKQFKFDLTITGGPATPFTRARSVFRGGPRRGEDVVLKHPDPSVKLSDNLSARYTLTVPYPTDIRPYVIMDFSGNKVFGGEAARVLEVYPRHMAGVHVFTYEGAVGPVACSSSAMPLGGTARGLNIHLYSQPDEVADLKGDHIHHFNLLVKYLHDDGMRKDLDLIDLMISHPPPTIGSAPDLSEEDLLSLYDLAALENTKDRGTFRARGAEPVECLQAWGT